jgi:hypothetical protein
VSVIKMTSAKTFADKKEICWRQNLLLESADKWRSADDKNLLMESADKNEICWQETSSSYKICLRKERHFAMEKILKYLLKDQMINATMNVSLKSIIDALGVNVYGR